MASTTIKTYNQLGAAQQLLEDCTKELKAAQANFVKAEQRLVAAKMQHEKALVGLNTSVKILREENLVTDIYS